jgi:hypothetical protein
MDQHEEDWIILRSWSACTSSPAANIVQLQRSGTELTSLLERFRVRTLWCHTQQRAVRDCAAVNTLGKR